VVDIDRVRMNEAAELHILVRRVVDGVVASELLTNGSIDSAFIGHERAGLVGMFIEDFLDLLAGNVGDTERAGAAIALDKGNDGFLGCGLFVSAVLRLSADVAFVGFNDLVLSAERAVAGLGAKAHGFANAMRHEPRRAIRAEAETAIKLMRTDSLLAGAKQMRRQLSFVHRDMRTLENRPHGRRKLFATFVATTKIMARGLANNRVRSVHDAAMRAIRTVPPANGFEMLPSLRNASKSSLRR
jgi:hypothetical protein